MFPSCKKNILCFLFCFCFCFIFGSDLKQIFIFVDSTLRLKVKKLEEERQRSFQGDSNTEKPDLKPDRLENEEDKPGTVSGEESDRENRSVNESNSTASGGGEDAVPKLEEAEPVQGGSGGPDPVVSGSSRKALEEGAGGGGEEESCELGDSVTRLSSESLSSGRKRKGSEGKEEVSVAGGEETVAVSSEPFIGLLEVIGAHKNASLFESLLQSQVCTVRVFLLIFPVLSGK